MMKSRNRIWITFLAAVAFCIIASIGVSAREYNNSKDGQWSPTYAASTTDMHRIFMTGNGRLFVTAQNEYGTSVGVMLYSRNKGLLQTSDSYHYVNIKNEAAQVYGVSRGAYYLRVRSSGRYKIYYKNYLAGQKGGASQSSARSITSKSTVSVLPANENWTNADWYKINLTSASKIRVYLTAQGEGALSATIYGSKIPGSSHSYSLWTYFMNKSQYTDLYITRSNSSAKYPLEKGVYYVKIFRTNSNYKRTSGCTWIRWKKI